LRRRIFQQVDVGLLEEEGGRRRRRCVALFPGGNLLEALGVRIHLDDIVRGCVKLSPRQLRRRHRRKNERGVAIVSQLSGENVSDSGIEDPASARFPQKA
jgi:hypothetical protein